MTLSNSDNAHHQTLTLVFMVCCCVSIFTFAILNHSDVWDMLGYAASVHSLNGMGISEIHALVYEDLKLHASATTYQDLTVSTSYRTTMSTDPEAFGQQIPFYKIRLLYVLLISAFTKFGFGIFETMHFVSAGFGSAGLLLIYFGLRKQVQSPLWLFTPLVFFGVTTNLLIVQQGGVDTFAFFWLSLTIVCYIRGSKLLLPTLALCVLVRTDLIIHAASMFAVLLITENSNRKQIILWGILTLTAYFSVNAWAGNFGWYALIHFVFVTDMSATHPAVYSQLSSFDFQDYLGFLGSEYSWISKWFWLSLSCALVSFIAYYFSKDAPNKKLLEQDFLAMQKMNIICLLSVAYVTLHYMLYPAIFMRFFVGSCFFMVFSMLTTLSYIYRIKKIVLSRDQNGNEQECRTTPKLRETI